MQISFTGNENNDKSNLENETKVNVVENNFSIKNVEEKTIDAESIHHYEEVCNEFDVLYKVKIKRQKNADTNLYIIKTIIDDVDYVFSLTSADAVANKYIIEFHTVKYGYALIAKQDGLGNSFVKNIFKARNIFTEKAYELSNGQIKTIESVQSLNGNTKEDIEMKKQELIKLNQGSDIFSEMNPQDINVLYEKAVRTGQVDYDTKIENVINEKRHSAFLKLYERYFLNWNVTELSKSRIIMERKEGK